MLNNIHLFFTKVFPIHASRYFMPSHLKRKKSSFTWVQSIALFMQSIAHPFFKLNLNLFYFGKLRQLKIVIIYVFLNKFRYDFFLLFVNCENWNDLNHHLETVIIFNVHFKQLIAYFLVPDKIEHFVTSNRLM